MAVTIVRTNWIDDDGTGTTGTVLNSALHTTLYNEIDTALAKVAQLAGGNTFTGNQTITGGLIVNGASANINLSAAIAGALTSNIVNSQAGASAWAGMVFGNDVSGALMVIANYSSTYSSSAYNQQNGSTIYVTGPGGLSLASIHASGALRLYTNSAERLRIAPSGEVLINRTTVGAAALQVSSPQASQWGILVNAIADQANGIFIAFTNAAAGIQGSITAVNSTTTNFLTSSDARLKDDAGRATDVAALRAVVVHDFTWKADGARARGVFAQETAAVFPRAISEGTDETTDDGSLARPWMTDYSKFVPDLIVGWQQHDAELAELRTLLATVKGSL